MRAQDVVGKRIVSVRQQWRKGNAGMFWDVTSLELEDGTRLVLHVHECEADYGVAISTHPSKP